MRIEQPEITQPNGEVRVFPKIGERVPVIGCYSEVMLHFQLAGRPCEVSLEHQIQWTDAGPVSRPDWGPGCQVWKDGERFSGLILPSEGGFYCCADHGKETLPDEAGYYVYMRAPEAKGDTDPAAVARDINTMIKRALAGQDVIVISNLGL